MIALTETDKIATIQKDNLWRCFGDGDITAMDSIDFPTAGGILGFSIDKEPSCRPNGETVPDVYNLVRTDTDTIIPIGKSVGKEFNPVGHKCLIDTIEHNVMPYCPDLSIETVATLYGGGTGFVTMKIGDDFELPNDSSPQRSRIIMANPIGRGSIVMGFHTVRIICMNTLAQAMREGKKDGMRIQHTVSADLMIGTAGRWLAMQLEGMKLLREKETVMATTQIKSEKQVREVLDLVYPMSEKEEGTRGFSHVENLRNAVVAQFNDLETAQTMKGKTAWGLFNAFTYPIFNSRGTGKNTDKADIQYTAMLGHRADNIADIFGKVWDVAVAA